MSIVPDSEHFGDFLQKTPMDSIGIMPNQDNDRGSFQITPNDFTAFIADPEDILQKFPVDSINSFISKLEEGVKAAFELPYHASPVRSLAYYSDLLATGSADKKIALWQFSTQTLLKTFENFTNWVVALAFTKDGEILIGSSSDGLLRLFSMIDYTEVSTIMTNLSSLFCIAVTTDYIITGSSHKTAKLWNLHTKEEEHTFVGHADTVYCLTVTEDGSELFTGSRDYSIKAWSITRKVFEYTLVGHLHWVYCVNLSNDQKFLVSGSEDKTVRVWNLPGRTQKFILNGHTYTVTSVLFTSDNKFIVSGSDSVLKVWNVDDQREVFTLPCHKGFVRCLATTNDRKYIVSTGDDSLVRVWDISDKIEDFKLDGHTSAISCLDTFGDLMVTGSEDKTVKLWNYKEKIILNTFSYHTDRIFSVAFSYNGEKIASSSADRRIIIWNLETQTKKIFTGYAGWIRYILWKNNKNSNSEFLYSTCNDFNVYITNVNRESENIVDKLKGHTAEIYCLAISNDSLTLFSGASDNMIFVWDTIKRTALYTLVGHSSTITGLALDLSGLKLVSVCSGSKIKVWNLLLKREEFTLLGHEQSITAIVLNQINGLIYTSSEDLSIKAWNIEEKRIEFSISVSSTITCIHAKDNMIFTGSKDKSLRVWKFHKDLTEDELYLPFLSKFDFTTVVCGFNSTKILLDFKQASLPLGKHHYTLTHLFAHQGKESQLEKILASGPSILRDKHGNSPLYYSLEKQSQLCTDMLLQYLINKSKYPENYINEVFALRGDLLKLISSSSYLLEEFLSSLMVKQAKLFAQPVEKLPIVKRSPMQKVFIEDFPLARMTEAGIKKINKEIFLQCYTTGFEFPDILGSEESFTLTKVLLKCSNKKAFESTLVQYYIRSKWNDMWYGAFAYTLLLWGNLVMILLMVTGNLFLIPIQIIFIIINALLLTVEIIQLINTSILDYFSSFWNTVDLLRVVICGVWLGLKYCDITYSSITWLMIFINFTKGVTGFSVFDKTRFYVRVFFKSFADISFFLMIIFYSTLGFGLLFSSNKDLTGGEIVKYLWISPFDLNLGNFETHETISVDYLGFFLASIVNIIVMLSLLISILGDSFDRFMIEAVQIDHIEMAELTYHLEFLLFWRKKYKKSSYMQICDTLNMSYAKDDWEGTTKALETSITKMFNKKLMPIEVLMEERHTKVLENIFTMEKVTNENRERLTNLEKKAQNVDEKMDAVISILGK